MVIGHQRARDRPLVLEHGLDLREGLLVYGVAEDGAEL